MTALVVVNAFGDVRDTEGNILAGARTGPQETAFSDTWGCMKQGIQPKQFVVQNTTLGVILTNARLDKAEARKLAQLGRNALVRVIAPVHTLYDGDIVFALSVEPVEAGLRQVGILGQKMLQEAIIRISNVHNGPAPKLEKIPPG